jgi:hypothetical protein
MPFGMRNYWTGRFLTDLDDDLIRFLLEHFARGSEPGEATVLIEPFHGAASRVPTDDTAFAFRHARFNVSGLAHWDNPEGDSHAIEWAAAVRDRLRPLSAGSYLNLRERHGGGHDRRCIRCGRVCPLTGCQDGLGPRQHLPVQSQHLAGRGCLALVMS